MIDFSIVDVTFPEGLSIVELRNWIKNTIEEEGKKTGDLNYQFCSDKYLHKINIDFLKHDTLTDIITFPNVNNKDIVGGDLIISIDRVKDNALDRNLNLLNELNRVIIHGVLHLIGYNDKTEIQIIEMREKENYYLNKFKN